MESFLSLGNGSDEMPYYKQIIDEAFMKAEQMPYAERRAFEMNSGGQDDFSIEGKLISTQMCRGSAAGDGGDQQQGKGVARPSASHQLAV